MDEQQNPRPDHTDDVAGHDRKWKHAETAEGDHDVEGHGTRWADEETAEGDDDTEGPAVR